MSSVGDSYDGTSSVGAAVAETTYADRPKPKSGVRPATGHVPTDDEQVTGVRGRCDDMIKALSFVRAHVDPGNVAELAGLLDQADQHVEAAADYAAKPE